MFSDGNQHVIQLEGLETACKFCNLMCAVPQIIVIIMCISKFMYIGIPITEQFTRLWGVCTESKYRLYHIISS